MVGRRIAPLAVLVALGIALYALRLLQLQVGQHEIWAREAANLLRSGTIVPYHRGRILDARERVLVADEDAYVVELVYRDLRREHPLGQVAHALSCLAGRAVPLAEALDTTKGGLAAHARALVSLPLDALDRFGRGEAVPELGLSPVLDPDGEARARRASDVRFYLVRLLGLSGADLAAIAKSRGTPEWSLPFVELAARRRAERASAGASDAEELLAAPEARLVRMPDELERLASLLEIEPELGATPVAVLVALLDRERRSVEDAMADALFRRAAGFDAHWLPPDSIAALDLGFLARALVWEPERVAEWAGSRRARWTGRDGERELAARELVALVELELREARGERLLDGLAALFALPGSAAVEGGGWRALEGLVAQDQIEALLAEPPRGSSPPGPTLALQAPEVREERDPWRALGRVVEALGLGAAPEAAERWRACGEESGFDEMAVGELQKIVAALESELDAALSGRLGALDDPRVLTLASGAVGRAREQEAYVVRDRSSRARLVQGAPGYDVVHLVSRFPERYAGFSVRATTRRRHLAEMEDGTPALAALIGGVRLPDLRELVAQREERAELAELFRSRERDREQERRLVELAASLVRPDQTRGGTGLEVYFDRELTGHNGWRETDGLQEREELGAQALWEPPRDGDDLFLTIDLDLQRAAQRVLAHPERPDEPFVDEVWLANPVGAIVLLAVDGDVLVAASEPTEPHDAPPRRLAQRAQALDRTLRRPTANPPGSALKPLVAAWALEYRGLDPAALFECLPLDRGWGWKTMHCLGHHEEVDLDEALRSSCNAYFARVGDELYTPEAFLAMARAFGLGQPTGVMCLGERRGSVEDWKLHDVLASLLKEDSVRRMAANGLGAVDATPMQLARAYAALATGRLPRVRLVRAIGAREIPHGFEELEVRPEHLALVRRALREVVTASDGSAHGKGLDLRSLGFALAAKTGSADFLHFEDPRDDPRFGTSGEREGRMRKHAWVAGWFPADEPRWVLVVQMHDIAETASRTATHLASQFLRTPELQAFVNEELARRSD